MRGNGIREGEERGGDGVRVRMIKCEEERGKEG